MQKHGKHEQKWKQNKSRNNLAKSKLNQIISIEFISSLLMINNLIKN